MAPIYAVPGLFEKPCMSTFTLSDFSFRRGRYFKSAMIFWRFFFPIDEIDKSYLLGPMGANLDIGDALIRNCSQNRSYTVVPETWSLSMEQIIKQHDG